MEAKFSDNAANVLTGDLIRTSGETSAGNPYTINRGSLAVNNSNYVQTRFTPNLFIILYPVVPDPPIVTPIVPPLVSKAGQTEAARVVAIQTGNMQSKAFCVALLEHYYNPTVGYQCDQPGITDMGEEVVKVIDGGIRLPKELLDRKEGTEREGRGSSD